MTEYKPDFAAAFRCLASACPDSCCRQGWQIVIDPEHAAQYAALSGELGSRVRAAMTQTDGEATFAMDGGVCRLLDASGLCPIVSAMGEEGLCHICHTHPRFLEEYGATREIHFSLSCPEAARLALDRTNPIRFVREQTGEPLDHPNSIDPAQYFALLAVRRLAVRLMQDRTLPISDRFVLLLRLAEQVQRRFDRKDYSACRRLVRRWYGYDYRMRQFAKTLRGRLRRAPYAEDLALLCAMEHLTPEMTELLPRLAETAEGASAFDAAFSLQAEHLAVLWLWHYLPKAVNDNDAAGKMKVAVFGWRFVRQACLCMKKTTLSDVQHYAGLFAKEVEHSEENLNLFYHASKRI